MGIAVLGACFLIIPYIGLTGQIYTDTVYFAPLTSSFPIAPSRQQTHARLGSTSSIPPVSDAPNRREWIQQWLDEHNIGDGETEEPIGPRPVSAKAMYRLADKLDLQSLKLRAFQHICSQLTVQNIPAEVFSRFSSTFEDVRKVQVAFFLKHWSEIKKSDTMTQIWQQIRTGKHVGFEEGGFDRAGSPVGWADASLATDCGTAGIQTVLGGTSNRKHDG